MSASPIETPEPFLGSGTNPPRADALGARGAHLSGRFPGPDETGPAGTAGEGAYLQPAAHPAGPVLTFIAHDDPVGQGNIRHLGKGRPAVHQNAKTLKPWRATVRHAAITAISDRPGFPLDEPLRVEATFTVKKPTGAPKTRRVWPAKRPDLDHLLRAILDAVTGVAFVDDARCVEIVCAKRYPLEGHDALTFPGVVVRIYRITGED